MFGLGICLAVEMIMLTQVRASASSEKSGEYDGDITFEIPGRMGVKKTFKYHVSLSERPRDFVFRAWDGQREVAIILGTEFNDWSYRVYSLFWPYIAGAMNHRGRIEELVVIDEDFVQLVLDLLRFQPQPPVG